MKFTYPGLTDQEVEASRARHGSNAVASQEVETFWDKLLGNLKDPIIIILIVALLITLALTIFDYAKWYESVGIAFAVVIATFVATWSEHSNEQSFQKLLEEASLILVKVFRNGHLTEISINHLVVGDHVLLQPGDTVPTDGLLIAGHAEVDEAALTGESEPVKKTALPEDADPATNAEEHQLFRAGLLVDGECVMRASAVGDQTRYGQTMKELLSAEDRLSPLQHKLTVLGGHISTFGYIGATLIFLAFMFNNIFLQAETFGAYWAQDSGLIIKDFVTAAILAIIVVVVAVPEGLPMMIAMVLAINMKKLLSVKVLVRKLLGIETAGSLNILFTDKTGTLTQGRLSVSAFLTGAGTRHEKLDDIPQTLRDTAGFALRNNTSAVIDASDPNDPKMVGADRTEQALLRFVTPYLAQTGNVDIVDLIPFNSTRKFSATQVTGDRALTLVKGAPEVILQNCAHCLDADGNTVDLSNRGRPASGHERIVLAGHAPAGGGGERNANRRQQDAAGESDPGRRVRDARRIARNLLRFGENRQKRRHSRHHDHRRRQGNRPGHRQGCGAAGRRSTGDYPHFGRAVPTVRRGSEAEAAASLCGGARLPDRQEPLGEAG